MHHRLTFWILFWMTLIGMFVFGGLMIHSVRAETNITELQTFLEDDITDEHEYLLWYSCGHFSRDLARNASEHNLSIGSVILSNHPVFGGKWNSHIMNYVMDNDTIVLIEPQTDRILALNQTMYTYYRLYPDGTQVPTYWRCNLAHTGEI